MLFGFERENTKRSGEWRMAIGDWRGSAPLTNRGE